MARFLVTFNDDKGERYETGAAGTAGQLAQVLHVNGWVEVHRLKATGPGVWTAEDSPTALMGTYVKRINLLD